MWKKIVLNTLYTIGIFISLVTAYWGITNNRYEFTAGGVVIAITFIFLKIKLTKEVRNTFNNK